MAATAEQPTIRREFLKPKEFSQITGASVRTVQYLAQIGEIASVRLGRTILVPVSEIERLKREAAHRTADR